MPHAAATETDVTSEPYEVRLRAEAGSLVLVRRTVRAYLRRRDVPADVVDDAVLIADELCTNAVQHGSASAQDEIIFTLTLEARGLGIVVTDTATRVPHAREAEDDDECGRGLSLVDALSLAWGTEIMDHGKRVWATLRSGQRNECVRPA